MSCELSRFNREILRWAAIACSVGATPNERAGAWE